MIQRKRLGEILVEMGLLDHEQIEEILSIQKITGRTLGTIATQKGFLSKEDIRRALKKQWGIPILDLAAVTADPRLLQLIPRKYAQKLLIVPLKLKEGVLTVATVAPVNMTAIENISSLTSCDVTPVVALEEDIMDFIRRHYHQENVSSILETMESRPDRLVSPVFPAKIPSKTQASGKDTRLKELAAEAVERTKSEMMAVSQFLHTHPEVSQQEYQSVTYLAEFLSARGFTVEVGTGDLETSFVAKWSAGPKKPTVAFIAEYDALPEVGHACGHNLIAAASIGAALGLKAIGAKLPGEIRVIGTPAEERGGGKIVMTKSGVFKDVDVALMFHPGPRTEINKPSLAMVDAKVKVYGQAAHSSVSPQAGVNALAALLRGFELLDGLRQTLPYGSKVDGIVVEGGKSPGIIPDYTEAHFFIQSATLQGLRRLLERFRDLWNGLSIATGCDVDLETSPDIILPLKINPYLSYLFLKNLQSLGIEADYGSSTTPPGPTDAGNLSRVLPLLHPYLGVGDETIPIHSAGFSRLVGSTSGQSVMIIAAKTLAMTAAELLANPATMEKVRIDFEKP